MKIIVCVKIVEGAINPFDECALEAALSVDNADVTVISMCPPSSKTALLPITRLGVKRVILLSDACFTGSDTYVTAYILSEAIKKLEYDMIFCGRQTIDGETAQVGAELSAMLGISLITNVMEVNEVYESGVQCTTRIGAEKADLPALLTIERINKLRFPSIRSKLGVVEIWDNSVINANNSKCGLAASPTRVLKTLESEKGRRTCRFIKREELLPLISELSKKPKRDIYIEESGKKLKSVWAVGDEVLKQAEAIADNVIVLKNISLHEIVKKAMAEKPDVILWNADLWGRRNAPVAAALLETGLCADCTALETDGEKLFMYRPAKGGRITAKIGCKTKPQMATVRTQSDSGDIIVAGGKGVRDKLAELKQLSDSIDAEICASRGLVDMGTVPYDMQVGLTGKMVAPKIYIAIGISGAVHHTCAIENADVVIAINPDKNARIFEYADYGIADEF